MGSMRIKPQGVNPQMRKRLYTGSVLIALAALVAVLGAPYKWT